MKRPERAKHARKNGIGRVAFALPFTLTSLVALVPVQAETDVNRLEAIESEIENRAEKQRALEAEAQALAAEVNRIRKQLIEAAAKVRTGERNVTESEDRIVGLEAAQAVLLAQLEIRRTELANTLAALQRLDRNPPPALAVKPDDAVGAMRSALLLSTIVPQLEEEARNIRERLSELDTVRTQLVEERETLSTASLTLSNDRGELNRLLAAKVAAEAERRAAADEEARALAALSAEAGSLKELIAKLEDRAARMQPIPRPAFTAPPEIPSISAPSEPSAPNRAVPPRETLVAALPGPLFSASRGLIRTPVESISITPFGATNDAGGRTQGIEIETRPQAAVTAPFDGRIAFAGPFRRYGQLLILEVGEGYHLLLAGMARIDGIVGQNVLAGEPVGTMGEGARSDNTGSDGSRRPSLYLELRRNGNPVDPEPWFVDMDRKARG